MGRKGWAALAFGLLLLAGLTLLRAADPYALQVLRETGFDAFQQAKPREAPSDLPVRIIDIDEQSLSGMGQWPWPRTVMAEITDRLVAMGAAAIAFDLLFSEPDRLSPKVAGQGTDDNDAVFARALTVAPGVLSLAQSRGADRFVLEAKSGLALIGGDPLARLPDLGGAAQPLPVLAEAAQGLGVASLDRQGAGVARRLPLIWRSGEAVLPSLSLEALRVAMSVSTLVVESDGDGTPEGVRLGGLAVPTGPQGDIWLYYRHLPDALYISARELLADDDGSLAALIEGHIVLVGTSAAGLLDLRASTLGDAVPGVSIHAQALEQMLSGVFLQRADWVGGLEIVVFLVAGLVLVLAVIVTGPVAGLVVFAATSVAILAMSWWAFSGPRLLIDPLFSLFGLVLVYAGMVFVRFALTDADRRRIRRAFAHYVEPSLLARIENDAGLLRLGGDLRELTVMFSDVRNFSALTERTDPAELLAVLNRLFGALGTAILMRKGTIDKFMGDAIMAFWNAPVETPDHPLLACRAALGMRAALDELNARSGEKPIAIGVGIATGPALVGNMGFEQRFDYSCIGETVNVASRIEGMCRHVGYDLLVADPVAAKADGMAFLLAGTLALRGMSGRETVHILVGDEALRAGADFADLAAAHEALLSELARGQDYAGALARCIALAPGVEPRLAGFYAAWPARLEDFRSPPPAA